MKMADATAGEKTMSNEKQLAYYNTRISHLLMALLQENQHVCKRKGTIWRWCPKCHAEQIIDRLTEQASEGETMPLQSVLREGA